MKIYEIGTGYTPIPAKIGAATEIVVEELTRAFLSQGEDVEILDISASQRDPHDLPITEIRLPHIFTKTDVQLGFVHKLKRVAYSISLAVALRAILKNTQQRVILHFHNQYNLFFFYLLTPKRLRKKAVIAYTVHSYIWHDSWDQIKATIQKKYFQESYCVKHADHVFVLNNQTSINLIQHLNVHPEKLHRIHNGVNVDTYCPLSNACINSIKEKYGVSGKQVLVQIGSVCDRKNQLSAVQMLYPLMQTNPQIVYCYAGGIISNEYQASIKQFASEHGIADRVIYLGELKPGSQLNEVYNMAEAMVNPSKAEGFSLVIVEAMSAGTPVIVHEKLEFKLSENCLKYKSPEDFPHVLHTSVLSGGKTPEVIQKTRQPIIDHYTWKAIAKEYQAHWYKTH